MGSAKCTVFLSTLSVVAPLVHAADEIPHALEQIVVVGSTPLAGSDVERDRVPTATQVLSAQDVNRTGIPSLTGAILANVPSASINDVEGNVFQPDILFRGFTASPVAGTPQGLAVYVNGARFNDAFGDTVNWDLIPASAIKTVSIEAANPVFGLNALGGSVSVQLKNGFSDDTDSVTAYGGSYGRRAGILEVSRQAGEFAIYLAADATHDSGFRQTSTTDLYRLYTDLGWRSEPAEVHLGFTAAHDRLGPRGSPDPSIGRQHLQHLYGSELRRQQIRGRELERHLQAQRRDFTANGRLLSEPAPIRTEWDHLPGRALRRRQRLAVQ